MGVAGSTDSKTPAGADRVECRTRAEYETQVKRLNTQLSSSEQRRHEKFMQHYEAQEKARRGRISWLLANESDPYAQEIYREALKREGSPTKADQRPWYSEVME